MNDAQIRRSFHRKRLQKYHSRPDSLVLNELGLKHGKYRADIAIVNGHLLGYEIKSDEDTLSRLSEQISAYTDVFDRSTVVVGPKYADTIQRHVPDSWGIIAARQGPRGGIYFRSIRAARLNKAVDPFSVAQLLWKSEAAKILSEVGVGQRILRQKREFLYRELMVHLSYECLRRWVRECLKNRTNWRYQRQPFLYDDSFRSFAK